MRAINVVADAVFPGKSLRSPMGSARGGKTRTPRAVQEAALVLGHKSNNTYRMYSQGSGVTKGVLVQCSCLLVFVFLMK